jgi:preprotein translocase subunit SecD
MEDDDIIDASSGFAPQSDQPIASFRFNTRGTRHFAHITGDNVGRPFAIVLDDVVLSVSVIREPILGGSGEISGNFYAGRSQRHRHAVAVRNATRPLERRRSAERGTGTITEVRSG